MTLVRTIISDGLREGGILPLGGTPDAASEAEGLRKISSIVSSLIGAELGENLTSISYGKNGVTTQEGLKADEKTSLDSSYVPSNSRIIANLEGASTLFLNPAPRPGARFAVIDASGNFSSRALTVNANGRKIENAASLSLATDSLVREWFYRDDLADWVRVTDLTLDTAVPFPAEFDELLVTMLAIRLNPRYGQAIAPETKEVLSRWRTLFRARYRQTVEVLSDTGMTPLKRPV